MIRTAILCAFALGLVAGPARADQLSWLTQGQARAAVNWLTLDPILVSYCSLCSEERVIVWRVERATMVPVQGGQYFKVRIWVEPLFSSATTFAKGGYREPVDFVPAAARAPGAPSDHVDIDLAYVYARDLFGGAPKGEFRVLGKILHLPCDVAVERINLPEQVLGNAPRPTPALEAVARAVAPPQEPVRIGPDGSIPRPSKIFDVQPEYPPSAVSKRVQGNVVLECVIGADGTVTSVTLVTGVPELNEAAAAAVKQWRFTPTLVGGIAVPVIMRVTVNFSLHR